MKSNALIEYRNLTNELLILREAEGGDLPDEVESAYVAHLDQLWWTLSTAEQEQFEAELASSKLLDGPADLALVDCHVERGTALNPRKAA